MALVAVGTVRADGGLFTLCVFAAIGCGSVAVAGGRTVGGLVLGALSVIVASGRSLPWWSRGVRHLRRGRMGQARLGRTALVCAALIAVFGLLFASADGAFAHLIGHAMPSFAGLWVGRAILAVIVVTPLVLGYTYLAAGDPPFDRLHGREPKTVRRIEWAAPVAVLDALFAIFVGVQLEFLFGGRQRVLRTSGLTYAQYARSGFWQLLVVVALTVVVIAVAARVAPRALARDRMLARLLLGALCVLTLVIVASALNRLRVYDDAYGFTRERLAVGVIEIWLGLVFVFILGAGIGLRGRWVPRAAAGAAVAALLATALANPDGFIANRNVDRYQRTGRIDVVYLSGLSADAVPALQRLPEPLRSCAVNPILANTSEGDTWRSWNRARQTARQYPRHPPLLPPLPPACR